MKFLRGLIAHGCTLSILVILFLMTGSLVFTESGYGQSAAGLSFYKGRTVRIIVSTTPGGGHDGIARFIAPHLQRYLTGSTVVVENIPGAGQLIGHNKLYASPPDGLTIGTINRGMIFAQLMGAKGIRFDLAKFTWLANLAAEPRFLVVGKRSKFQSLSQIVKGGAEIKMGCTGGGTVAYNDTLMLREVMNWPVRVVAGYGGSSEAQLAVMKGEVDAMVGIYDTMRVSMESGDTKPLLQMGGRKVPGLENVPLLKEVMPPGNDALMDLLDVQYSVSRLITAPPGLPAERRDLLRGIFSKMAGDKKYLNAARKVNLTMEFTPGEELEKMMKRALRQPPQVIDLLKRVIVVGN